ncbi:alpha/beta fold hydrolase [Wenxinia marina]|uniref:Putative hydrolase or acyltransferase (Alpha/beta hydrolase superfamily) n=1 Tax=Wenxinia marina DSM 24838 TaxID=1123501 RepID=A0A0D0QHG5_9RHOB|nr:alpha/beta hydrolase [Wenxinia marina]KIQ70513.1 putative hydrolase or acyltransferase (alpha/beta hydrolase superfamily) [Wenxinia marina DSM 24838]GGL52533.1 hypothetical protein GCM10011392_03620 [Wenxinia marina]
MTRLPLLAATALTPVLAAPAFAQDAAEALGLPAPAAREGQTLSVNGADIFVSESGEGEVLYLLHGYPLSGALFERVRDRLDDEYRVVTIDHRGYGNSTAPEVVGDVATYAEDALSVLDELGIDSAVIGGMSMGGPILFEMYRQNPDVFDAAILIDTNPNPANEIEAGIWNGAIDALAANSAEDFGAWQDDGAGNDLSVPEETGVDGESIGGDTPIQEAVDEEAAAAGDRMADDTADEMAVEEADVSAEDMAPVTTAEAELGMEPEGGDANGDMPAVASIGPVLIPDMLTGETRTVTAPEQAAYLSAVMQQASDIGAVGGAVVLRDRPDSTPTLAGMDIPVLVLVGREDSLYPVAVSEAMVEALPQGEIAIIDDAAHAAIFEQPEASADAILEWLSGLPSD